MSLLIVGGFLALSVAAFFKSGRRGLGWLAAFLIGSRISPVIGFFVALGAARQNPGALPAKLSPIGALALGIGGFFAVFILMSLVMAGLFAARS
jgi:hypothetical protein